MTTLEQTRQREAATDGPEAWTSLPATRAQVEITPGHVITVPIPDAEPKRHYFAHLTHEADGTWTVQSVSQDATVRMTHRLPRRLGIDLPHVSFYKLLHAGCITAYRPAPSTTLVSLTSLLRFLRATRVDPDRPSYWTRARRQAFRHAYGSLNGDQ